MLNITGIHHVAILVSDIDRSLKFYGEVFGFVCRTRHYREERQSWKADLFLGDTYCLELFTFKDSPPRLSRPEALGLRHLAFTTATIEADVEKLNVLGIVHTGIQIDPYTGKQYCFFSDPDELPIEIYAI